MTCKKAECKYEFCWVCLGDWKGHTGSFYECNRFVENDKDINVKKSRLEYFFLLLSIFIEHLTVYTLLIIHEKFFTKRDMLYIYTKRITKRNGPVTAYSRCSLFDRFFISVS